MSKVRVLENNGSSTALLGEAASYTSALITIVGTNADDDALDPPAGPRERQVRRSQAGRPEAAWGEVVCDCQHLH